jgi:HAD superfamily hydrolase (TIGR01509 family)
MIKLIIFDLDGVLIDAKKIHFEALNLALDEINSKYTITWQDHLSVYDGLKTNQKLEILTDKHGLDPKFYKQIWDSKQKYTELMLDNLNFNKNIYDCLFYLKSNGYKIACCSNSILNTIFKSLKKIKCLDFFDLILSNEDVINSKPHPEIYWEAMSHFGFYPEETIIIEDSPYGLKAASSSGAYVYRVKNPNDITSINIINNIKSFEENNKMIVPKWTDKKLNVLIPMAGAGSRFEKAGYTFPKPLIEVGKKPMIQVVIENLNIDANYIFVVQRDHRIKYNLDTLLNLIAPGCKVIETQGVTEGAACTALLAAEYIDNEAPLFFANSDQFVDWNSNEFMYKMNESEADGGIVVFDSTHPKWSFAEIDKNNFVVRVAEKDPISTHATVGFYYWKKGSDFIKYANQMIDKNIRVNNEFYVCPVFNEAIQDDKKIISFNAKSMWGLGTPEDLDLFLKDRF